jgi:hypothetical protein
MLNNAINVCLELISTTGLRFHIPRQVNKHHSLTCTHQRKSCALRKKVISECQGPVVDQ